MNKSQIVLSEDLTQPLEITPAPLEGARRWRSRHEDRREYGWPAIFMTQGAYHQINAHAGSHPEHEVGGMLVGHACRTPEGELYVVIEAQLPARHVEQGPAHLTFTSASLVDVLNRLEEEYPDRQLVGWYHTHPGLSVFMSSMDMWLHTHFFSQPWHVALVIDPHTNQAGFFRYSDDEPGYPHPHNYIGFYELAERNGESVVTWENLSSEETHRVER